VEIDTVRVRAHPDVDRPALRLRVDSLLSSATWRPPGMSPASVLVVRRLADPLPGALALDRGMVRVDPAWERALHDALARAHRHALWPARRSVPPDAAAVLFADEAEMLACLALDLSRGSAGGKWWWQHALRTLPPLPAHALETILCRQARLVPAAFSYLAGWGQGAAVACARPAAGAARVLSAVRDAFALAAPDPDPGAPGPQAAALGPWEDTPAPAEEAAPWARRLPPGSVPDTLGREQACLLGVSLVVHRRPGAASGTTFLRAVRQWASAAPPAAALPRRPPTTPGAAADPPGAVAATHRERPVPGSEARRATASDPKQESGVDLAEHPPAAVPTASHSARPAQGEPGTPGSTATSRAADRPALAPLPEQHAAETDTGPPPAAQVWPHEGVPTRLGGVLYLINLMRSLDLPACFEETWRLASEVGPWGVLEGLGRALLGEAGEGLADDALWQALAALDGRPLRTLPGHGFRGAGTFRLPVAWVTQAGDTQDSGLHWAADGARLRVWEADRYLVVDRPLSGNSTQARATAIEELAAYQSDGGLTASGLTKRPFQEAPLEPLAGALVHDLDGGLARWLAHVVPYVRLRLRHALDRAGDPAWGGARALLLVPGHLYVTPSHVDLVAALDAVSLPVRVAGLDFDPGWLPDFGRVVQFHFE
jgi:hypothetical protein